MKNKSKAKIIIITVLIIVTTVIIAPFSYTEYRLIRNNYTKATDFVKIVKVNNDSEYEVLRTVKNQEGVNEQIVVAKDLSDFSSLIGAEWMGNTAHFTLSDGRKCYVKHDRKSFLICGRMYDYNIFIFSGITIEELLADADRISN